MTSVLIFKLLENRKEMNYYTMLKVVRGYNKKNFLVIQERVVIWIKS